MVSIVSGEVAAAREEKAKGITMLCDESDLNNCIDCGSRPVMVDLGSDDDDLRGSEWDWGCRTCQVCCSLCSMATGVGSRGKVMDDWQRLNPK